MSIMTNSSCELLVLVPQRAPSTQEYLLAISSATRCAASSLRGKAFPFVASCLTTSFATSFLPQTAHTAGTGMLF